MRKTKIVCTLGPSTDDEAVMDALVRKGMDVARMNFSHGDHEEHQKRVDLFRKITKKHNAFIPLLLDTKGPEIRTGKFKNKEVTLTEGNEFVLTPDEIMGDENHCSVSFKDLYKFLKKGDRILINDGLVELKVKEIVDKYIHCTVQNGGIIGDRKSINVPGIKVDLPSMTEQDIDDIIFGIKNEYDFIAASFVRKAADVLEIRKVLEQNGGDWIQIIAKIENREGIENFDEIIKVADGIMVARGDLGVEIPPEEVPVIQKTLIEKCYKGGKPVITATQMLDSMMRNPRPTRAEVSDVANAIYDSTSAIMLSGETASGKYPVESLETMVRIAERTEACIDYRKRFMNIQYDSLANVTNAISHATCTTSHNLDAAAIITVTKSGHTARMISRFRPACPIIACTMFETVRRQLSLSWGVCPILLEEKETTDELFDNAVEKALETGIVKNGDMVVITAGIPVGVSGTTNILKAHIVGHILAQGTGVGGGSVSGEIYILKDIKSALTEFKKGSILVAEETTNETLPLMKKASGIIIEKGGVTSHAAIVGMTLEIPVIVGTANALELLKNGTIVTIDAARGLVYKGVTKV